MKKRNIITSIICSAALLAQMCTAALSASAAQTASTNSADGAVTTFTFSDSGIEVSNENDKNYTVKGTDLSINGEGSYIVTGSCADGSIKVKKNVTGVTLTLSDLTLSNSTTAPIVCAKNSQTDIIVDGVVTLEDSVKNAESYWTDIQTDNSDTDVSSELDEAENAVIKLKGASKITLGGDGELNITANAKNGIKSGATLDTDLETELAANSESSYYSYLTINDLTLNITANNVYEPKYDSDSDSSSTDPWGGNPWGGGMGGMGNNEPETYGDGINAESYLAIESGTLNIKAGDDGIHCDYTMDIGKSGASDSDLDINITECYEGIEAATLNFYSGDIDIAASDDAINAANGDLSSYSFALNVYGGDIYADASNGNDNDALDSNGSITINGASCKQQNLTFAKKNTS